jgi:hypothetical protein
MTAAQELAATVRKAQNAQQIKTYNASISLQASAQGSGFSATGTTQVQRQPTSLMEFDASSFKVAGQDLGAITEIITPQAFYMKMPMLSAELHKEWMELPFSELKGDGATLSQLLSQAQSSDPLSVVQLLAAAKNVRTVGTSTVDGVAVTELAGSVAANAAIAKLPASLRTTLGQDLEKLGVGQITFQVWVDGQQDARKEIIKMDGSTLDETISTTVTGINQPVHISLPAAGQVATIPASALSGAGM